MQDYLSYATPNLRETFKNAKETGLIRLEITYCLIDTEEILTDDNVTENLIHVENLSPINFMHGFIVEKPIPFSL